MITISAFRWVPDFAQGQVRDLRARWALEEAGLPYKTRLLEQGDQDKPDYRALQPFGQVPVLEEDGFVLFESGAIVLHIGERSEALLPKDAAAKGSGREVARECGGGVGSMVGPRGPLRQAPPPSINLYDHLVSDESLYAVPTLRDI